MKVRSDMEQYEFEMIFQTWKTESLSFVQCTLIYQLNSHVRILMELLIHFIVSKRSVDCIVLGTIDVNSSDNNLRMDYALMIILENSLI